MCIVERSWNMWIPGFGSSEEPKPYKKAATTEAHKQVCVTTRMWGPSVSAIHSGNQMGDAAGMLVHLTMPNLVLFWVKGNSGQVACELCSILGFRLGTK